MLQNHAKLRVLLLKPYQPTTEIACCPPLGILYLTSVLRKELGDSLEVYPLDAKLYRFPPQRLKPYLEWADIVGLSALNYEAPNSFAIARLTKLLDPKKLVVIGGPLVHSQTAEVLRNCPFVDWAFDGEAERTFPEALRRWLKNEDLEGISGLYFRREDGTISIPKTTDTIADLDAIPFPAWEEVDFEEYARQPNMNSWMKGKRYAPLFTSRGCPYKCNYCHDIFGKRFRFRSAENVMEEMRLLIEHYQIDEFQIVDDIFNLHKPRLKKIFALLKQEYPNKRFYFCFPNGLRGDILDEDVILTLKNAGAYQITLAVETVTSRLQHLIEKYLDVEKVFRFIELCARHDLVVKGYFMLGFPTETPKEIWNTIRFALRSRLTMASFFQVVPQPGTPLYAWAERENPRALKEVGNYAYYDQKSWYARAYGYPLHWVRLFAIMAFYLHPSRLLRILRLVGLKRARNGIINFLGIIFGVSLHTFVLFFRSLWQRKSPPTLWRRKAQPRPLLEQPGKLISLGYTPSAGKEGILPAQTLTLL